MVKVFCRGRTLYAEGSLPVLARRGLASVKPIGVADYAKENFRRTKYDYATLGNSEAFASSHQGPRPQFCQ